MLSKNVNNKKYVIKFAFFNEKNEIKKIQIFFFDFESQILALFDTSPLHQFAKFNDFI